jgi:hypothetical protein
MEQPFQVAIEKRPDDEDRLHLDLVLDRYTDFTSPYLILDVCGQPLSYLGATAILMFRRYPRDTSPLVTITQSPTPSGGIYFFPNNPAPPYGATPQPGGLYFQTTRTVNAALAFPEVVFDMVVTWSTGFDSVLVGGRIRIREGVTR